jgi:predicted ATPase/class 3 adenylate cyclase
VFTDIEGSTRLLQSLGPRYRAVLERHHEILRSCWRDHAGLEVKTDGDAFFVVFKDPTHAVAAAACAQRSLAAEPWGDDRVRVRVGIHTGVGLLGADDYVGLDVHRAARIAAAGHGGQVLLSEATRALVERALPDGVALVDLGQHRLKDIDEPERLAQLTVAGLDAEFAPLRSLDARPTNLPPPESAIVGRTREMEAVRAAIGASRLVTLTGAGGTGKSALALAVAESLRSEFPDGVFVSWLAPIRNPELLAAAIAGPLGVQESGGRTAAELLPAYLRGRQILLVLDNFEQLAGAAAYLAELLMAAPGLRLLVTSQVSLGLRAEQVYEVPPLPVPARGSSPDVIRSNPSVILFEARVRAVRPNFQVTDDEAGLILEIVERLDGLPLAIELAAARMRMLTPAAVLARLDRRLAILTGGGADRPERHQTLRAALDWSFELLEPDARKLLARLSVFGGGFDLAAVEAVCGQGIDALQTLVEHSLVRAEEIGGEPRFSMLEAIREYAAERLAEGGDEASMQAAHAAAFLEVAETHRRLVLGREGARHLDRLERDHDNLRGALRWAIDAGEAEIALRMAASLWRFWQLRGHLAEGRQWTEAALALAMSRSDLAALRSAALVADGGLLYWQADLVASTARYAEALSLARAVDDASRIVEALGNLGMMIASTGRTSEAATMFAEGMPLAEASGDRDALAILLFGDAYRLAVEGRLDDSYAGFERAATLFREVGNVYWEATSLHGLGQVRRLASDAASAEPLYREALIRLNGLADRAGVAVELDLLAVTAIMLGDPVRGMRLAGAAAGLRDALGAGQWLELQVYRPPTDMALELLEPVVAREALAEGRSWSLAAAVAYALGPDVPARPAPAESVVGSSASAFA